MTGTVTFVGLRLPRLRSGGKWRPSTDAERHLLSEAMRLDAQCRRLAAEVDHLRGDVTAPPLTADQLAVLTAAAGGAGVPDTARQLFMSEESVKAHRKRALAALGAASLAHAVALAVQSGWIHVGTDGSTS
ncbi:LuxR C-terminal-related transcriptional regulator [Streptomyces griseoincarnatus]